MASISERFAEALRARGLKQADVAERTGIGKSSISTYLSGAYEPKQKNLHLIAKALNVSEAWLMGKDVPMERSQDIRSSLPPWALPITTQKVPLIGEIACGEPIFADEDFESYVLASTEIHADFALRAKGDSMIGARIYDGDIVFIREQPSVDNGEIAAVIIDEEATLKRVYKLRDGTVELRAENPRFAPIYLGGDDDTRNARILGKAIAFQGDVI